MKVGVVLGTRPEIIKMAPIVRALQKNNIDFIIIHTNQHYSDNMDKIFFEELELPQPDHNLNIGSGSHGEMTGRMLIALEKVFIEEEPDVVLVQGDTNTVMAGALVASKLGIKVGHVEAGLRSYDRTMPEELNRIVTDHISDYLFPPTQKQADIIKSEGIDSTKVYVTGNTVVDSAFEGLEIADRKSDVLNQIGVDSNGFILLTTHRPATVDSKENLSTVLESIQDIASESNKKVIFPSHPRTKKMIEEFGIELGDNILIIEPVGYLDMLMLQKHSYLIATDSGGIQEESCVLEKKAIILRENTERPEAVEVGGCVLVGNTDKDFIVSEARKLIDKNIEWYNPFGDGTAGEQIVAAIQE